MVVNPVPLARPAREARSSTIRDLLAVTERPEVLSLAGGLPDPSTFPAELLARVSGRLLVEEPAAALQYGPTAGYGPLRAWVADRHGATVEAVVITHGSQQALELALRTLLDPGDLLVVPDPAYVGALQAAALVGAELLPIPTDEAGLRTDALEAHLRDGARPRACYLVADLDNPTGATLGEDRRRHLAALADRYGITLVDDEPYGDLRWAGPAPTPLRSLAPGTVTLGTTSKLLCPGLRVGWAIGPEPLLAAMVRVKQGVDLQTATFTQRLVHGVLTEPDFLAAHVDRLRAGYRRRAEVLQAAVAHHLPTLELGRPDGGMFLWGRLPGVDTTALLEVAVAAGTAFVPGAAFAVATPAPDHLRLSHATATEAELEEAAARLARAVAKVTARAG